jgi:hypothetical protein
MAAKLDFLGEQGATCLSVVGAFVGKGHRVALCQFGGGNEGRGHGQSPEWMGMIGWKLAA